MGHIPKAGCLSSDGTWASWQGRWVSTHPGKDHQFVSLYWQCRRKPEKTAKVTIRQCHFHSRRKTSPSACVQERYEWLTWLPPIPWQLKMPTFSFSFLAMLSRHWLVSTFRIWMWTDHTHRSDAVNSSLAWLNTVTSCSLCQACLITESLSNTEWRCIDELKDNCANQIHNTLM